MSKKTLVLIFLLGIIFSPFFGLEYKTDFLKISVDEYNGIVSLFRSIVYEPVVEGDEPKIVYVPLLDTKRYTALSSFYVMVDKDVYAMDRSTKTEIQASLLENGVQLDFIQKELFSLQIKYTCFPSSSGSGNDCIKVLCVLKNISNEPHIMTLKNVYDTVLGEVSGVHFSTAKRALLDSEYYFSSMRQDKYIRSGNDKASIQFLLDGGPITSPQTVIVANKDLLHSTVWIPSIKVGRSFDSLTSFNNSAVAFTWNQTHLKPNQEKVVLYYITTATFINTPANTYSLGFEIESIATPSVTVSQKVEAKVGETPTNTNPVETSLPQEVTTEKIPEILPEVTEEIPQAPVIPELIVNEINVDLGEENPTTTYDASDVQDLLRRIYTLEATGSTENQELIKQLNAEIDSIMEKLRR
mgnify:CR=1 FL=1